MSRPPPIPTTHGPALDYAAQSPRPNRQIFSTVTFIALLVPLLLVTVICGPMAAHFEVLFKDFNVALPGLSRLFLQFARFFRHGLWVGLWLAAILIPFAIAPLLSHDPDRRRSFARVVTALCFALIVGLLLLAIFALFMPLVALIDAMSGK